ncbi:type II toxin-antitoxin system VapC family toxin [Gordonia sp. X0973]|uniref:type II toxin-antitoxin system VapC family toxin n=1 Tax=Gordonia sp. X0973 TaxID=2742602 RepID=UPI000F5485F9|nr:type II toxin-antitoxin system VapC family toxin [Gordonia sp. X0973]QKT06937.1 type II toxin-antitoxin system VapC family toxin [Gordonia sp. X0973]
MIVVDTSVLIDVLRGTPAALDALRNSRRAGPLHASEVTRLEVLAGMRPREETATRTLLATLTWHPVDEQIAEAAGSLGREWLPAYRNIDSADLAIAATAIVLHTVPLTKNVKHFPMFPGLAAPY